MPLPPDVVDLMTGSGFRNSSDSGFHPAPSPKSVAVYRFFDADGSLLYVGMTEHPLVRFAAHRTKAPWWSRVDSTRTTVTWCYTRAAAEKAELKAIADEEPEYNVVGKDGYRGGRRKTVLTKEQEQEVAAVVGLFQRKQEIEAEYKRALAELTGADEVPIAYIAGRLGLTRKTVYRHLGRSMT